MQNGKYTKEQLLEKLEYALKTHETTNFDFKRQWSDKIEKTVCSMLNIIGNNDDAFIFIGIDDKTREILGTDLKDENHFNTYKFNIKPNINIDVVQKDGKNIQVISIWNRYDKPYFQVNGAGQMNSVIMTRNNSASLHANPQEIEELYKYRFRIDEDVRTKIIRALVQDIHNWECQLLMDLRLEAYYLKEPSYKIVGIPLNIEKKLAQAINICYNTTTILSNFVIVHMMDGAIIPAYGVRKERARRFDAVYNAALLFNMAFGDGRNAPRRTVDNFRETFEKACEENGIIWE